MPINLKFDEPAEITLESNVPSQRVIDAIRYKMYENGFGSGSWEQEGDPVYKYWDWAWKVEGGEYKGTLPKRLESHFYKSQRVKLPEDLLKWIGDTVMKDIPAGGKVKTTWDISKKIDWKAGQFGEPVNSCFWAGSTEHLARIKSNGGFAIRAYKEGTKKGIARAWCLPAEGGEALVLFNAYGFSLSEFARILSVTYGLDYVELPNLTINKSAKDVVFLNGGGKGYMVGPKDLIKKQSGIYNLHFKSMVFCNNCQIEHEIEDSKAFNGRRYCPVCYQSLFKECTVCGKFQPWQKQGWQWLRGKEKMVCTNCQVGRVCVLCNERAAIDSIGKGRYGAILVCKICQLNFWTTLRELLKTGEIRANGQG